MSYFMGVLGGQGANPAAALVKDGELIAFAEEERYNRIKCAPLAIPVGAMSHCLETAGIGLDRVEQIGFGWDCERYVREIPAFLEQIEKRFGVEENDYNRLHELRLRLSLDPSRVRTDYRFALAKRGYTLDERKIVFHRHHLCHAASAFYCSGFERASILTLDGSGEEYTCVLWEGRGTEIREFKNFKLPDTLGGYYATFTEFLGFKPDEEEGKVMGLAPYGRHDEQMQEKLGEILRFDPATGDFSVDPRYRFFGPRSQGQRYTDRLVASFGAPRLRHEPIEDRHRDIAFNVQWRLERVALALARQTIAATGIRDVCLSGGVAMNCKMNGLIASMPEVERIFVQPASGDAGVALGAAYLSARAAGVTKFSRFEHAYWGSAYSDAQIESALREAKIEYRRSPDIVEETATHLAQGRIAGWFQGATEVGARALGNRSILANPLISDMRDKLNREVKHREGWRPFCPSVSEDQYARYFPGAPESDFMILAFPVADEYRAAIPAAVHVDGTARPQRVTRRANPRFHALLKAFGRGSGHEMLINTSFNIQGEPIVNSPRDAVRCFGGTGIDVLAIGDFIAVKPGAVR